MNTLNNIANAAFASRDSRADARARDERVERDERI